MEDKEKSQKTVVAFVAGLLIGGLLVWVFSIAPKDSEEPQSNDEDPTAVSENINPATTSIAGDDSDAEVSGNSSSAAVAASGAQGARAETMSVSGGSISVKDQPAGTNVTIDSVDMPVANGWIAIHEERADHSLGNVLGVVRYSEADKLTPMSIHLLRAMKAGKVYHAVLYAETRGSGFSLAADAALMNGSSRIEDAFTAQ